MQPWQLSSSSSLAITAQLHQQLLQLSCTSSAAICSNSSPDSLAAMQPCSLAALQPCSRAAVQPCSRAALQPCGLATQQPCSATLQPQATACSFTPLCSCSPNEKPQNLRCQLQLQQRKCPATDQKPEHPSKNEALQLHVPLQHEQTYRHDQQCLAMLHLV